MQLKTTAIDYDNIEALGLCNDGSAAAPRDFRYDFRYIYLALSSYNLNLNVLATAAFHLPNSRFKQAGNDLNLGMLLFLLGVFASNDVKYVV